MSIEDHKWSDEEIESVFVRGERICFDSDKYDGSWVDFNSKDSLAIAKHFKQDREALVNKIKALIERLDSDESIRFVGQASTLLKNLINEETNLTNKRKVT